MSSWIFFYITVGILNVGYWSCKPFSLSVQGTGSIEQIIKSLCLNASQSVSKWVSQSVTLNKLNALPISILHLKLPPR